QQFFLYRDEIVVHGLNVGFIRSRAATSVPQGGHARQGCNRGDVLALRLSHRAAGLTQRNGNSLSSEDFDEGQRRGQTAVVDCGAGPIKNYSSNRRQIAQGHVSSTAPNRAGPDRMPESSLFHRAPIG